MAEQTRFSVQTSAHVEDVLNAEREAAHDG